VDRTELAQGDPVTWTVTLEGEGNLKATGDLIIPPLSEFRTYDPQVTTTFFTSTERYGGKKVYERVLVPLHSGVQRVPPASFVFFDPDAGQYQAITSAAHALTVRPRQWDQSSSLARGLVQAEIRQRESDIRFIQPDAALLHDDTRTVWHSRWYWATYAIPLTLVAAALGVRWRREYRGEDPTRLRALNARSEARKRLKAARSFLKRNDYRPMTGALGTAIGELVAGHANVSASGLTSDRIKEILGERGVSDQLIEETLAVLDRCDRARYAPASIGESDARDLYERGYAVVRDLTRRLTP
jgi:hypothetical protein